MNNNDTEIRVKINSGYLVATRNDIPDCDGICITFETNDGDIIDVVSTVCKSKNNKKKIEVYTYEDVYTEDFTRKYVLDIENIIKAVNE